MLKSVNSSKIKGLIGIILIVTAVGLIYYWENFGRQQLLYKEVIIAKEDIYKNDKITNNNITFIKLEEYAIPDGAILKSADIMGKEAKQFIPKNAVMDNRYLAYQGMTLRKGQFIFRIPSDWIKDFPGTLRRGDQIFLYPMRNTEIFEDEEKPQDPIALRVAYVKDSGNREVRNIGNHNLERFDGTANVHSIEVMMTKKQLEGLQAIYDKGYQFLMMYQ